MLNGQTLKFKRFDKRSFAGGMQQEPRAAWAFRLGPSSSRRGSPSKSAPS